LNGVNDWANLKLKGGAIGLAGIIPVLPTMTEADLLTKEEASKVIPLPGNPNLLYLPIVN
jgi:hypothetical protein